MRSPLVLYELSCALWIFTFGLLVWRVGAICDQAHQMFDADSESCLHFYMCKSDGNHHRMHCQPGLHWNQRARTCDWPFNAKCKDALGSLMGRVQAPRRQIEARRFRGTARCGPEEFACHVGEQCIESRNECDGVVHCLDASDEHSDCGEFEVGNATLCSSGHTHEPDPDSCARYYLCKPRIILRHCQPGLHFNVKKQTCVWPVDAKCDPSITAPPEVDTLTTTAIPCPYQCLSGECLIEAQWCNGIPDCRDMTDEINCRNVCNNYTCVLPDCACMGTATPNNMPTSLIPQIVTLTFEGGIRQQDYDIVYNRILRRGRKNPNGCAISATFFVSHEYTDYVAVKSLYYDGHEMAAHSISKRFPESWWRKASYKEWEQEIAEERIMLNKLGDVNFMDVRGMRAPFLQVGGNTQFQMLHNNRFLYDSSMPVAESDPPLWPFTLDIPSSHRCIRSPCPTKRFPGLWEVPLVFLEGDDGLPCATLDGCSMPRTKTGLIRVLKHNFERHYASNRAPLMLSLSSRWFTGLYADARLAAMEEFLDELATKDDVWLLTVSEMIAWIRNPAKLEMMMRNATTPWACDRTRPEPCSSDEANVCNYGTTHLMGDKNKFVRTCSKCPRRYPWVGNPSGS